MKQRATTIDRREALARGAALAGLMASAGLWPTVARAEWNSAAFDSKVVNEAIKALGGAVPVESKDVTLTGPDIAENGAVVPVGVSTNLKGIKRLLVLVEKNPAVLSAAFDITDAVDANIATRVKMGQTSNVYGVAMMSDGKVLFAQKEIKVTLGGCGG